MRVWSLLSLFALLCLPPSSTAQARWVTISNENGQRIEVDTADVGITGSGHITLWWRLSYRVPHSIPSSVSPTTMVRWSSMTEHEEINCHEDETRIIQQTSYNAAGDAVDVIKLDSLSSFDTPTPDSVVELVMQWACKHL